MHLVRATTTTIAILTTLITLSTSTAFTQPPIPQNTATITPTPTSLQSTTEPTQDLIKGQIDEKALLSTSTFPISPPNLIRRAKEVLELGIGTKDDGKCLSPNFEFCAAVVGPLKKDEYLSALQSFQLERAFPDLTPNYYGFYVDPFQPHRVWFFSRSEGTNTEPFMGKKASGVKCVLPPQLFHLDFDENGLVTEIGFYTVDRRQGNTGGLGGAFGYLYGTGNGLPIPECKPYKKSWRFRMLNWVGSMARKVGSKQE